MFDVRFDHPIIIKVWKLLPCQIQDIVPVPPSEIDRAVQTNRLAASSRYANFLMIVDLHLSPGLVNSESNGHFVLVLEALEEAPLDFAIPNGSNNNKTSHLDRW